MGKEQDIVKAGGIAVIKELTRLIPFWGGTAVSIFEEIQSKQIQRKIQRLSNFYSDLSLALNSLKDRINQEYVNKDDFLDVFETATRYVILEREEAKRKYFKNILVKSIISVEINYDKTEKYFRLLDYLTLQELTLLAVLDNPREYNINHGFIIDSESERSTYSNMRVVSAMGILTRMLGITIHEAEEALTVLISNGLVKSVIFEKQLQTNGNSIPVLDNLLTTRGLIFIGYIKDN